MIPVSEESEYEAVAPLWQEHLDAEFPAALRGAELDGIDLVMLDADIAGCVSTWCGNGGFLDAERLRTLRRCVTELDKVLPLLMNAEELRYYKRLHRLATHLTVRPTPHP
ncbi:hypothetical protein GCM10010260_70630 [Streptomyces filipinensis]|uniref:Uncharacterized protein n=1 Tax=Streptomyces filipinensis TaxID=66887 RepID=A0A918IHY7_9ACTN|nr:hypothetical protein [Streptomyces filipinensis]GGV20548.1 hypothetical protein GCM10010260_70630 [Streptomyces filipinensis]